MPGKPFEKGADERRGKGPAKGTGGRPPNEFKTLCRELATKKGTLDAVERILADQDHGQFMSALKWATENGYGKAPQPLVGDPDNPLEIRGVVILPPLMAE